MFLSYRHQTRARKKDVSTTPKTEKKRKKDAKKSVPYDRVIPQEKRTIPIEKLILPRWGDLRSYRDEAFKSRLRSDLVVEGMFDLPLVRACPSKPDCFEVLDGLSRIEELRELGETAVDCMVVDLNDIDAISISLKSNIISKHHDPIGIAYTFELLHDQFGMKYDQIAARFHYSRSYVYKLVRLLALPKNIQQKIAKGDITINDGLAMVAGNYSPDVLAPDGKNKVCDVCHGDYPPHLINRILICYRCEHRINRLIDEEEEEFKLKLELRAKQAKEGQKRLVDE